MDAKPSAPGYPQAPPAYAEAAGGVPPQTAIIYPPQQMPHPQGAPGQPIYVVQQPQEIIIVQSATKWLRLLIHTKNSAHIAM
uniref:DAZ-associated protein 2 n=1 Tax=Caenorhabditis tropicalis TaxID=1561998 RepID=A0A1I7UPE7_9PELO